MKRHLTFLAMASLALPAMVGHARAQTAATTNQIITLDQISPETLAGGYRVSKIIGSTVVNARNETIGTLDDLIITPAGPVPFAVLSVGGFLGLGDTLVVVPANAFERTDKALLLRGATRENLKQLPAFSYGD